MCVQVDGYHVEGAVIKYKDGQISLVPHIQGGKAAETSATEIVLSVDESQQAFNEVRYVHTHIHPVQCHYHHSYPLVSDVCCVQLHTMAVKKKIKVSSLPVPLPQGALLLYLEAACNDAATVETAKVKNMSEKKLARATQMRNRWKEFGFHSLEEFDKYALHPLFGFYCSNHKAMLLAKMLRETDHLWLVDVSPPERDKDEFKTSNFCDMLQLQLSKLFGHTKLPYAFGHGVMKFRAYMQDKHTDSWRGKW